MSSSGIPGFPGYANHSEVNGNIVPYTICQSDRLCSLFSYDSRNGISFIEAREFRKARFMARKECIFLTHLP